MPFISGNRGVTRSVVAKQAHIVSFSNWCGVLNHRGYLFGGVWEKMREMGEEKLAVHNTRSFLLPLFLLPIPFCLTHTVPKLTTGRLMLPSCICGRTETLPFLFGLAVVRGRMVHWLGAWLWQRTRGTVCRLCKGLGYIARWLQHE